MKKRTICLVLAVILLISAVLTASVGALELPVIPLTPAAGPGDADGDGSINAKDVTAIMKYMVGNKKYVVFENYADYNGDGKINARDVLSLMLDIVNGEI